MPRHAALTGGGVSPPTPATLTAKDIFPLSSNTTIGYYCLVNSSLSWEYSLERPKLGSEGLGMRFAVPRLAP